ncbi:glycosyltransferase family 2 protein [Arthrobacter sp. I2-34]|uniref:Glycosyltransferase family 2 protein n=1 Tax=Arthrobacter hankyongi TaxID=2904801 RepID=A0ABS9L1J0_9MICC|nr:glycosyltransferase family 2 protein [Arthrobacter hankyongi]MCG2620514.1 glycosyltransferase family 2 protein [Arthrobacter hankyongi]
MKLRRETTHRPFVPSGRCGQPSWRPGFASVLTPYLLFLLLGWWTWTQFSRASSINAYIAIAWTLPTFTSVLGLYGGYCTARRMRSERRRQEPTSLPVVGTDQLLVVMPTIGRDDTLPAVERVIESMRVFLPACFTKLRIDVVIEEECPARRRIEALAEGTAGLRVVVVPRGFRTPHGTRFKARANEYANRLRAAEGEAREDVWVLHMDDDTGVGSDTARELARFILAQRQAGDDALDLCQGVLSYPRELAANRLIWLADAIRPGCDLGLFAATTGRGSPRAGLHGELLLVRASVEAAIGWDFGPRTLVEDAQFALHFCERYPGRSGWIPGLSYGASPATASDFMRQRERWVWGLLELMAGRTGVRQAACRRHRLLMLHNTVVWSCAPLGHPVFVLMLCALLQDYQTAPIVPALVPLWGLNVAFCIWLYWEGLKLNALASARASRLWWEPVCLLLLTPLFSLWEMVGIARGVWRFAASGEPRFTVITKPV